ncbi:hypothetical protein BT96DRAFT_927893 [Gymnopus androsaceus JB14]|uniref:Uncharacterized protein n=1 Tax=Gymnopus androsaceus JB14 TaxID=1447944 RepID=A0A6A4GMW9_9AGAR|nr:hypothetical protein BT96DRAFT_927893 [Gymnopus androsaceus JB14]
MKIYVDIRLKSLLFLKVNGTNVMPFDQDTSEEFYLILNVAVGGINGWFPDRQEDKPAMRDFTNAQSTWSATWPEDDHKWGDYVKMWRNCDY